MKNEIYIVQHSYELNECDETKFIGVFSTLEKAKKIVEDYKKLPGFNDYSESFFIDKYEIDTPEWKEGFIIV